MKRGVLLFVCVGVFSSLFAEDRAVIDGKNYTINANKLEDNKTNSLWSEIRIDENATIEHVEQEQEEYEFIIVQGRGTIAKVDKNSTEIGAEVEISGDDIIEIDQDNTRVETDVN